MLNSPDYDEYWRHRRNDMGVISQFQKQRTNWIIPKIKENSTVLDIGCGDGGVLLYLMKHRKFTPIGADISDRALAFLKSRGIQTIKCDLSNFNEIESLPEADHIILFEVLEHTRSPERLLKVLENKAKISIFFSFPNTGYFPYRIRMVLGRFVMQWRLHPGEHVRFWTYKDLRWWLKELGYENRTETAIYEGVPLLNRLWGSLFGMAFVGEIKK